MRQADRHATGPGALSPLLAGTLALLALAAAAGEAAAQAGAALDHWRHRSAAGSAHPCPAARRRPNSLAARGDATPGRRRRRVPADRDDRGCAAPPAAGEKRRSGGAAAGYRPQRPSGLTCERAGNGRAVRRRSSLGYRSRAPWRAAKRCTRPGRTCSATSGGHAKASPPRARSRRCWPRPVPRSRPRTSPTCTRPPGRYASSTGASGISIPRRSRRASLIGGGTRSATSHRIVVRSS